MLIPSHPMARPTATPPSATTDEVQPEGVQSSGALTTTHVNMGKTTYGSPVHSGMPVPTTTTATDPDQTMAALRDFKSLGVNLSEISIVMLRLTQGIKRSENENKWTQTLAAAKNYQAESDSMKSGAFKTLLGSIITGAVSIGGGAFQALGAGKQLKALGKLDGQIKGPATKIEAPKVAPLKKLELADVDKKLAAVEAKFAAQKLPGATKAVDAKPVTTKGEASKAEAPKHQAPSEIETNITLKQIEGKLQMNQAQAQIFTGLAGIGSAGFNAAGETDQAEAKEYAAAASVRTAYGQQAEAAESNFKTLQQKAGDMLESLLQSNNQTALAVIHNIA